MKMQDKTPLQAIMDQHAALNGAIDLLQDALNGSTSDFDPETVTWKDVGEYAKIADLARALIEECKE